MDKKEVAVVIMVSSSLDPGTPVTPNELIDAWTDKKHLWGEQAAKFAAFRARSALREFFNKQMHCPPYPGPLIRNVNPPTLSVPVSPPPTLLRTLVDWSGDKEKADLRDFSPNLSIRSPRSGSLSRSQGREGKRRSGISPPEDG